LSERPAEQRHGLAPGTPLVPAQSDRSIDHSLFSGLAWTALARWAAQLVSWVGTLYAAHLLMPSDYGLVAMANVPVGLVRIAENFGLDAVLVQDRKLDRTQLAQLAGLALLTGLALMLTIMVLARPISSMYGQPRVAAIIVALSVLVPLEAAQVVPRARLQIEMAFRTLGALTFVQTLVATVTVVACAALALGAWSLVLNVVLSSAVITIILSALRPYRVAWPGNPQSISRPILSGWRLLVARAGYYASSSADQAIIGRVLGASSAGIYSFAQTFSTLPVQEITSVVGRVVPGVFSSVQTRPDEMRRYFLLLSEASSLIAFPAAAGIGVCADLLVNVGLGPQWQDVIGPLRILCLYAVVFAGQDLVAHVLLWTGRFRANMWLNVLGAFALPPLLLIGARHGLSALCVTLTIGFAALSVPGFVIAARIIHLRWRDFGGALWPAIASSSLMCAGLLVLRSAAPLGALAQHTQLLSIVLGGLLVYAALLALFFRKRVLSLIAAIRASRTASH
jgi:O-antigen/teichoic acid export membrane protein